MVRPVSFAIIDLWTVDGWVLLQYNAFNFSVCAFVNRIFLLLRESLESPEFSESYRMRNFLDYYF